MSDIDKIVEEKLADWNNSRIERDKEDLICWKFLEAKIRTISNEIIGNITEEINGANKVFIVQKNMT
jgi:hypothetical protein